MSSNSVSILDSNFSLPGSKTLEENSLKSTTIFDKEAIQSLPRQFIITQLREAGFTEIAEELEPVSNPNDPVHEAFHAIAVTLSEEREDQFADMLSTLGMDENSLKHTYDTIVAELFKGQTHWGKIVTFIVFTSHMVLHCARRESLRHKVPQIVEWTDAVMHEKLQCWVQEQGGWQAFVDHFDVENWRVSLSTVLLGLGLGATVVAGGLLALKKMLQL